MKAFSRDFIYVLTYSLAFGFVRVSSGPAKAVAEPAMSKVARVKSCMIAYGNYVL